jgi:cytochrome P450
MHARKRGKKKNRRYGATKSSIHTDSADVLEGPGFRMERDGRFIRMSINRTPEEQRALIEAMANSVDEMRTDMGRRAAAVEAGAESRLLLMWGRPHEDGQIRLAQGMAAFWRYAETLVASRAAHPRDDFTSALLLARDGDVPALSHQEVTTIVYGLLFAGHETTTSLMGNATRRLLTDRHAWEEMCRDPARIPNAIEEVLRFDSSVIAWRRQTTQAVAIGGVPVPAHANVLLLLGSANRDPAAFEHPDRFDIHRWNAKEHLSFGYGAHFCLGAPLGRLEARVVLEELRARLPSLRLVPGQTLRFQPNTSFRGPLSLLVEWDT